VKGEEFLTHIRDKRRFSTEHHYIKLGCAFNDGRQTLNEFSTWEAINLETP
jgi:hypothetical protein